MILSLLESTDDKRNDEDDRLTEDIAGGYDESI
jgi:hypothetical protein